MKGLIGLTGNIATGKSEVARALREFGATVIDADQVARDIVAPGQPALQQIAEAFGPEILLPSGALNRKALGDFVFGNPAQLRKLEAITSPFARTELWLRIAEGYAHSFGATAPMPVVAEVIRLFEGGYAAHCQQVWVTNCPPSLQIARLMEYRHLTEPEARMRVQAQPAQSDKVARAQVAIDTSQTIDYTRTQVREALQKFCEY